ncbi:hypothetical protein HDU97_008150 [Phlyctochytrium planicorne]|nr:hypothetical protein HDU97_008150 [Phlyctochytrium planicorne]
MFFGLLSVSGSSFGVKSSYCGSLGVLFYRQAAGSSWLQDFFTTLAFPAASDHSVLSVALETRLPCGFCLLGSADTATTFGQPHFCWRVLSESGSRIYYDPQKHGTFEEFHSKHPPSKPQDPLIAWIQVDGPSAGNYFEGSQPPVTIADELKKPYNTMKKKLQRKAEDAAAAKGKKPPKRFPRPPVEDVLEFVDKLAVWHGYLSGKWLVFAKESEVDKVVAGNLGTAVKVSTVRPDKQDFMSFACNYMDQLAILNAREVMREEAGIDAKIHYKPDIYTILGLYAKNPCGVPGSRYTL